MPGWKSFARHVPLVIAYGGTATLTITLTRFDNGVACLWIATAILIAVLLRTPRRDWAAPLILCGATSFAVTFLVGLGPMSAGPFVIVNLVEALVAAILLKRRLAGVRALGSLNWFGRFILAAGVIAPAIGAVLAASWFALAGLQSSPVTVLWQYFTGHSLGNLAFTPLAMMVSSSGSRHRNWKALMRRPGETCALMAVVVAVVVGVFAQDSMPLLFLPILPIVLACFRMGREAAALGLAILALVGGILSALGHGPIMLLGDDAHVRLMFFQLYLATTVLTILPMSADLTNRRRLHRHLRDSEQSYRLLADHSTDIIFKLDLDGRIRFVTPSVRQMGYSPDEMIGRNCMQFIHPADLPGAIRAHRLIGSGVGMANCFEYRVAGPDGTLRWYESHARLMVDSDGSDDGMVSIVRDISGRKSTEEQLRLAALTDVLTGLANRRAFCERVESRRSAGARGDSIALLDIDHFKQVNDRFGHEGGDDVLRAFAESARRAIRDADCIARIGGEEFAILFTDTPVDRAMMACERLRDELAGAVIFAGDAVIRVTVSGGVAAVGHDGLDRALRIADEALYRAKQSGRDRLALAA